MAELAVVNSSPLIFLAKAGLIDLLRLLSPQVMVPDPVAQEIGRRGPKDLTARVLADTPWLVTIPVAPVPPLILS